MLSKILASMAIVLSLLGSGTVPEDDTEHMSACGYIAQWNPECADTLAYIYTRSAALHGIPLERLVRQGAVESRFTIMAVGDGGASVGLHQIKWAYYDHDRLLRQCSGLGEWMDNNAYCPRDLLFDPTWNIEVAALKLRQLWDKYGSLELALVAYGCGQNSTWFALCADDPSQCYRLRHVRQVMGTEKIY